MKISLNWIKQYTAIDLPLSELVDKIGAQLGGVEEVIDLGAVYKGAVVAKVITCAKHPNADKLNICLVDDGGVTPHVARNDAGYVQVVCGAPNVKAGLLVVWLPPGATVPATAHKDPLVLEAREIRGQTSNGMLASPSELAVSGDHDGLLILDATAKVGESFADLYDLNDTIIDIENKMFTHRPDCFGIIGVAREIAGITHQKFTSPDWYTRLTRSLVFPAEDRLPLEVRNQLPNLVPRFMAITLKEVVVKPSPFWMQSLLNRVGIRPINNIVDITNYMMYLTGQPMHAYDYDKLRAQSAGKEPAVLEVRNPKKGEKILLLNGKEIEPRPEAIVIASASRLIGIGGVMGGAETEVDNTTTNIILECATFDMYSIRRTSMEHGLFTDAVTRYNKGQSPLQNDKLVSKAIELLQEHAEAQVGGRQFDDKHIDESAPRTVSLSKQFINERLGLQLTLDDMAALLRNVEFEVDKTNDGLVVSVPFWRTDIEIPEDIVEEVGRLYGFDHLPLELPRHSLTPAEPDESLTFKARLRNLLSSAGANEVLTYSFVHGDLLTKVAQPVDQAYRLSNALSPDLQYVRLSLTPSLIEKVHANIKAGFDEFAIFEIGKIHNKTIISEVDGLPIEQQSLALVVAANDKSRYAREATAFYQARAYLDYLASKLGLTFTYKPFESEPSEAMARPFDWQRAAHVTVLETGVELGVVGEYRFELQRFLKLPRYSAGFEIMLPVLSDSLVAKKHYEPLSKYPKVSQDISLRVPVATNYYNTYMTLLWALPDFAPKDTTAVIEPISIYQDELDTTKISYTFRVTLTSHDRTLTTAVATKLLNDLANKATEELGAQRV